MLQLVGDTFVGAFSEALAQGKNEDQATAVQIAAALSVTRPGAQPSIPGLADVSAFAPS